MTTDHQPPTNDLNPMALCDSCKGIQRNWRRAPGHPELMQGTNRSEQHPHGKVTITRYRCERCGTRHMQGLHMSHRQARGMGGSKTRGRPHHRLSNVNALCAKCHLRFVEKYPTLAIAEGWKVKTGMDPSTIPILMYDGWHLCLDTGVRVPVAS